ncbi:putative manganese-dependent inorganic diphosphatase [Rariglobus hedericola]|uniref:inorganic diphosphatase n=1 Tax=Rariglobus hedericola TaxID=2597822 RepID=A0A556QMV1_9BACT|nr:putative manganese-dependent inorganic diphosphatase [Rariglobus hedericola]TSJ77981.1 putative manganese-dependent inorganic diphosphatase [Rariglobus hedericola]
MSASPTYIIGHKNPDADAICSAIAYAALKEAKGETGYAPARCGNSNARIDTILARFHQPLPIYLSDVTPRVRDVMVRNVVSICQSATCAEALELIDQYDVRILPVVTEDNRVIGTVSIFQLGSFFVPHMREPREMRKVFTSLTHISRALKAHTLHVDRPDLAEELFVRVGAMDVKSFGKVSAGEGVPMEKTIIIVGDRRDIQMRSIELGVRALVVTGNLPVEDSIVQAAKTNGVALIVSPLDSATTAWVIRSATTLDRLVDRKFASLSGDIRLGDLRKKLATSTVAAYMVVNDEGKLQGILTKTDVLKPVKTRLVLVDHNEMSQAVSGADQVTIVEIIDHHRLGSLNTQQPILFINEPVGSTCTIIADLFRREGIVPSPDIAGIMMSGIISDTLHLNSPTTTEKDGVILSWLAKIASVDSRELANEIFSSGSVILANSPDKVIRSDFKIYEEDGIRFAVSQIEELGFGNFWPHSRDLAKALQTLRDDEALLFACVLVTDINTQNSLLLVKGEAEFINRINYPSVQKDEIFDMPGVVSRKKQLIPYIGGILKEMQTYGVMPTPGASAAPFDKAASS